MTFQFLIVGKRKNYELFYLGYDATENPLVPQV